MIAAFNFPLLLGLLTFYVFPSPASAGRVLSIVDQHDHLNHQHHHHHHHHHHHQHAEGGGGGAKADRIPVRMYRISPFSSGGGDIDIEEDEEEQDEYQDDEEEPLGGIFHRWAEHNSHAFNETIQVAQPGDTVLIPEGSSFVMMGGIVVKDKKDITLDFAGAIHFVNDRTRWPVTYYTKGDGTQGKYYNPGILVYNCTNVTLTSSSLHRPHVVVDLKDEKRPVRLDLSSHRRRTATGGLIYGNGQFWWNSKDLNHTNHTSCARLIQILESADMLVENLTLVNSPYWALTIQAIDSEVRHVNVLVDRFYTLSLWKAAVTDIVLPLALDWVEAELKSKLPERFKSPSSKIKKEILEYLERKIGWLVGKASQVLELNTDGIDPSGSNIRIHDCIIQNEDDSIGVKPMSVGGRPVNTRMPNCTRDITIERMVLTGIGASIGSVPGSVDQNCVDGVVFRNIAMPGTGKGIYVKSDWGYENCTGKATGVIKNIVYENIDIYKPWWWAVWIGPQQIDEPGSALKLACALTYPISQHCLVAGCVNISDITLRNVHIEKPLLPPYVIRGNGTDNPIRNLRIENLTVTESLIKTEAEKIAAKLAYDFRLERGIGKSFCYYATGTYDRNTNVDIGCLTRELGGFPYSPGTSGVVAGEL